MSGFDEGHTELSTEMGGRCAFSASDVAPLMAIMVDVNLKPGSPLPSHVFGDHGVLGLRTECCPPDESTGQGLFAQCRLTKSIKSPHILCGMKME